MTRSRSRPVKYNPIFFSHLFTQTISIVQFGEIMFYFETDVGAAISIYGGMSILGNKLTQVYLHPFAEDKNVFIIMPNIHTEDDNPDLEIYVITKLDNNRDPYHYKLTAAWFLTNTTEKSFNPLLF